LPAHSRRPVYCPGRRGRVTLLSLPGWLFEPELPLTMSTLSPLALRAATLLADGDIASALQAAQACLQAEPDNAPVWTLLGVCAARLRQGELAETCWRHALQLVPATADVHYNLACLYGERGETALAEQHYRAELERNPSHPGALGNLGVLLAEAGQTAQAEACYRQVLAVQPEAPQRQWVRHNLARLMWQDGRPDEAEAQLQALLRVLPEDESGQVLLGKLYQEEGHAVLAQQCWEQVLRHHPGQVEALNNLALLYLEQKRWDESVALLQQGLTQQGPQATLLLNLANVLQQQGKAQEALAPLQQALQLEPCNAALYDALGVVYSELRDAKRAEAAFNRAVQLAPQQPRYRQNLGYFYLAWQRWSEGWSALEARLQRPPASAGLPLINSPRWQGETLTGKHLLVWFEQGLGDALQFCRYLPCLQPARLSVVCRPELIRLLQGMALGCPVDFLPLQRLDRALPEHDCHVFSMSLPHWLGGDPLQTTAAVFAPLPVPFLPAKRKQWRLGLVWRGHVGHPFDHHRSLPDIHMLAPLLALPEIEWLSLQLPVSEVEQQWLTAWPSLSGGEAGLGDLADTAAVLAQLDGLVSVDTALAHLAGSLGLPCWLMLSACHTDWRWGWQGESSAWYPSMRLRRQQHADDWPRLISMLAAELAALVGRL